MFRFIDSYAMKDIKFIWKSEKPVTISSSLEMPDFLLTGYKNSVCQQKTTTGKLKSDPSWA